MSANDIHGVQSGWSVKSSDGHTIGSVDETTHRYILVKSGLLGRDRHYLPAGTLEHVRPDLDEIEVALTREEFDAGDWSEPPAEEPRVEGAPLNANEYPEVDSLTATVQSGERRDRRPG